MEIQDISMYLWLMYKGLTPWTTTRVISRQWNEDQWSNVSFMRKPQDPEETTDLHQVHYTDTVDTYIESLTYETFTHTATHRDISTASYIN